jgi:hypothetical protein
VTDLDFRARSAGYFDSAWPAECGGPRRQKLVGSPGLALRADERLRATHRPIDAWSVMFVQRAPGELYLQGGTALGPGDAAPAFRADRSGPGWLERVDPETLQPIRRSPDLPSGGWLWCGAVAVHANGDLYVVNGRYCHRLDPDCNVLAARELPFDGPYNGLLLMSDGNIVTRNLGHRDDPASFVVLEPSQLELVGDPCVVEHRCMGRFSSDLNAEGELIYFTTDRDVRRLRYRDGSLSLDAEWVGTYSIDEGQSDAWDTSIGTDSIWLMDMGRLPSWRPPGTARQRAFRFSVSDPSKRDIVDCIGRPGAFNTGPPLYDPVRRVLVHYDALNGVVAAHRYVEPGTLEPLWQHELRNFMQMICWADTGELVVEDANAPFAAAGDAEADMVVLDVESGVEKDRVAVGFPSTSGMFCTPGFARDFYVASVRGGVARVYVD